MIDPTIRLYLEDAYCFAAESRVVAVQAGAVALEQSCFFPGGGGQPPDQGVLQLVDGAELLISSTHADADGVVWHECAATPPVQLIGQPVRALLNPGRRLTLMRYHTALHVLNTLVLRDYAGWITGVQMAETYARIDFKLAEVTPALCTTLAEAVNAVLAADHPVVAYTITEEEFRARPDLLRTLEVQPPIVHGQVRIVAIQGFDAQACGGAHVRSTAEVGHFTIIRTENKGKQNKRFYVQLAR